MNPNRGCGKTSWAVGFPSGSTSSQSCRDAFPASLTNVSVDDFYWAVNSVRPSLIRVEADETTYNLHIAIRFELERDLIDGSLSVDELPSAWNDKYEKYLGIAPPSDADGVLQDIHWSSALVGYFPTYALGNLYAAQLFEQAQQDLADLDGSLARGEFAPLRDWLRQKIHSQGRRYSAGELVQRVTGQPLSLQRAATLPARQAQSAVWVGRNRAQEPDVALSNDLRGTSLRQLPRMWPPFRWPCGFGALLA